jgi:hypothetical protein
LHGQYLSVIEKKGEERKVKRRLLQRKEEEPLPKAKN